MDKNDLIIDKAKRFLTSLHPPQKDRVPGNEYALFPFEHKNRETFDYFAASSQFTHGLPIRYLNPDQLKAFNELLQASLSEIGFKLVNQVRLLENVLSNREKDLPNWYMRDPLAYFIAFFGMPSAQGKWSWRIQGHHLSLQWTFLNGKIISSTPQFIGAQPAKIQETDVIQHELPVGERVLGKLEDLARDLINSLTEQQQQSARGQVPWDIDTTNVVDPLNDRRPNRLEDDGNGIRGILYGKFSEEQKTIIRELIKAYTTLQLPAIAEERMQKIEKNGWDQIRFFFMNGYKDGDALYYKIRGSTFMIEYINKAFSPPHIPADHQHAVWRDYTNDWGRDILYA